MESRLTPQEAGAHIRGVCFKTGPPSRVGIELEWAVHDCADPLRTVSPVRMDRALAALGTPDAHGNLDSLPGGSSLTREPGGQVELSSRPGSLLACVADAYADHAALREALAAQGLVLAGWGLEPHLNPPRVLEHPRYQAMEAYFDRKGPWGRLMMRSSAGVQINVDAGDEDTGITGWRRRWRLAHRIGPVLAGAFANSPLWRGHRTAWRSTRQAVWTRLDPCRTHPPSELPDHAGGPRAAWVDYALDAHLLCVRRPEPAGWEAPGDLTLRDWLDGACELPGPTRQDLDYHLTTLFPPVRPRGFLELRMIDQQRGDDWAVALAVTSCLMDDPVAAETAWLATEPICGPDGQVPNLETWTRAARYGLSTPELGKAALGCFAAAEGSLAAMGGAADGLHAKVASFIERYVARGRCPADDRLDEQQDGSPQRPVQHKPKKLEDVW